MACAAPCNFRAWSYIGVVLVFVALVKCEVRVAGVSLQLQAPHTGSVLCTMLYTLKAQQLQLQHQYVPMKKI